MLHDDIFLDQTVLITGGTGSFGRACIERLLEGDRCKKVIVFSRDELKQWEMSQSSPLFNHPKMRYFIGDVRDEKRLHRALHEVDIVIHAAALKQVPAAEYNPSEFVKTNIGGAQNLIDAAIDCGVKKVIALSSDKAVNPVNLYGATKLCADKLFVAGNSYVGQKGYPTFSVVRYGNVLASRGSILSHWKALLDKGVKEIPITDKRMTRFWITLNQAIDFVLFCTKDARGGEIYVPKIPSMKITDLAEAFCPGIPVKIIGIRPGEKLHETMVPQELCWYTREYPNYFMIIPSWIASRRELQGEYLSCREGAPVPEGFAYTSDTNTNWLSAADLKRAYSQ